MSKTLPPKYSDTPAMPSVIRPSGLPDIELPFGPPAPEFSEKQPSAGRISKDLHRRIRALANNANRVRRKSPLVAAQCWHESGRLLEHRAGRLADAWVCYSRAIALFPEYRPSVAALRRLARLIGNTDILEQLIDIQSGVTSRPSEKAGLLSNLAVIKLRAGDSESSADLIKKAIETYPDAVVPRLLGISIFSLTGDVESLVEVLTWFAEKSKDPVVSKSVRHTIAKVEEKEGRFEKALELLPLQRVSPAVDIPVLWTQFKLCVKTKRSDIARATIQQLGQALRRQSLEPVFTRLREAIALFYASDGARKRKDDSDSTTSDKLFMLIKAMRLKDADGTEKSIIALKKQVTAQGFQESLAISHMLHVWQPGKKPELFLGQLDSTSAACRATLSFLMMGSREEARAPEIPAAALQRAIEKKNWKRAVIILKALRDQTTDREARWPLAVAEAGVRIERLKEVEKAIATLFDEDKKGNRIPFPAILRRYEKRHRSLAQLAISEAENAEDKSYKAARLSWAGYHMESADPFESAKLYTESLVYDPSWIFSIIGLNRTAGTTGNELVKLYLEAAESTEDVATRLRAILRAAIEYLVTGQVADSVPLLGEAATLSNDDSSLQKIALRFAASFSVYSNEEIPLIVRSVLKSDVSFVSEPTTLGAILLFKHPASASEWFEKALERDPSDRVAARGLTEALTLTERTSILSERLLAELRNAESTDVQAGIYQRLAHIDRFLGDDTASAALSLLSLDELLPGHRSTLTRLAIYFLSKNRKDELHRVLGALARTVIDDVNATALLRLDVMWSGHSKDILRALADKEDVDLLELTELEAVSKDQDEREELLTQIIGRLNTSQTYISRLADCYGEKKEFSKAATFYRQSGSSNTCSVYCRQASLASLDAVGDHRALVDALVSLSDFCSQENYRVNVLTEAAEIAREKLKDTHFAAELCLRALKRYPHNHSAYLLAREMLSSGVDDYQMWLDLFSLRLKGVERPLERYELHLNIRDLLSRRDGETSKNQAEEHLENAMKIVEKGDIRSARSKERSSSPLDFDQEVLRLTSDERMDHPPKTDVPLYLALADTYMNTRKNNALARKYYWEALDIDRSNVKALTQLARLYKAKGDYKGASDFLDRLVLAVDDPDEKVVHLLERADILLEEYKDEKKAEEALLEAHGLSPLALKPLKLLAKIYRRQGDQTALNVRLNNSLQAYSEKIVDTPGEKKTYETLGEVLKLKGERSLAGLAADARVLVSNQTDGHTFVTWKANRQVGNSTHDDYLCPQAATIGLRECFKVLEIPLSEHLGVKDNVLKDGNVVKLKKRDKLSSAVNRMASWFGFKNLAVWVGEKSKFCVVPDQQPFIVFPSAIQETESPGVRRFAIASALQMLRMHLGLVTCLESKTFMKILFGVVGSLVGDFSNSSISEKELKKKTKEIQKLVPAKKLERLTPSAHGIVSALESDNLIEQLMHVGFRSGFLAAGSLEDALLGLRTMHGHASQDLVSLPGARLMMAFAFSRDHIELRTRFKLK